MIIMGRDEPRGFCGKVLNYQIFIAGYRQFLDKKNLHAAPRSNGYGASKVARKLHRRLSVSGIATCLKNGSVTPSEAPKETAVMYNL
jgi:hypothetical protein